MTTEAMSKSALVRASDAGRHWSDRGLRLLESIRAEMAAQGLPLQADLLGWQQEAGPECAAANLERIRKEAEQAKDEANDQIRSDNAAIEAMATELREEQTRVRREREQAEKVLCESSSRAGVPCSPGHPDLDEFHRAPSRREVAGGHGIPYVASGGEERSQPRQTLTQQAPFAPSTAKRGLGSILANLAPPIIGLVVGISVGVVTGLVDLEALQDIAACWPQLVVPCALGIASVYLLGGVASRFSRSLNDLNGPLTWPDNADTAGGRTRRSWLTWSKVTGYGALLGLGALAEINVEAHAISDLYMQHLAYLARVSDNADLAPMALWLAALIGCIITLPYVTYKLVSSDQHWQDEQTRNYLAHLRRKWHEAWIAKPEVREALEATQDVLRLRAWDERLSEEISDLVARKRPLLTRYPEGYEQRIQEAEITLHRERHRFGKHLVKIVNAIAPLPRRRFFWRLLWAGR